MLTSDEGTKFGIEPGAVPKFVEFLIGSCPHLRFCGLMSMGKLHDIEGFKVTIISLKSLDDVGT